MNSFMSSVGVICKDDNSGSARVYADQGTPPFTFTWSTGEVFIDQNSSEIDNLFPGVYYVNIRDTMGCVISDSIDLYSSESLPYIFLTSFFLFSNSNFLLI